MSDFVAECRREWKRLRVPDPVAAEMAAELEADLSEAAAEGVPAEEVLGAGAADPRSFAASWAAERGVVPPRAVKPGTRTLVLAAIAVLSAGALAAGVALLSTSTSASTSALPGSPLVQAPDGSVWFADGFGPGVDPSSIITVRPVRKRVVVYVKWLDPATNRHGTQTVNLAPVLTRVDNPLPSAKDTGSHGFAWILLAAGIVGLLLTGLTTWWRLGGPLVTRV